MVIWTTGLKIAATVKAHVSAVLRKLNVQNRAQAILAASCLDLVSQMRK
ncbi:MAG: hypothetical protein CMG87_06575 [Marinobacter sp.]|nr:hypothetical protein [Marinobacter sp.]